MGGNEYDWTVVRQSKKQINQIDLYNIQFAESVKYGRGRSF